MGTSDIEDGLVLMALGLAIVVAGCTAIVPRPTTSIVPTPVRYSCADEAAARAELQHAPTLKRLMDDYERERHVLYAARGQVPPACSP